MKVIKIAAIIAALAALASPAYALTAFLVGERVDGMNKICFYESPRGQHAITISAVKLCPLSIDV